MNTPQRDKQRCHSPARVNSFLGSVPVKWSGGWSPTSELEEAEPCPALEQLASGVTLSVPFGSGGSPEPCVQLSIYLVPQRTAAVKGLNSGVSNQDITCLPNFTVGKWPSESYRMSLWSHLCPRLELGFRVLLFPHRKLKATASEQ